MLRRIDRSRFLSKLLERLSTILAKQRGLPVVIGIAFVIVSFVIQLLNVSLDNQILELFGVITLNGGVLIALIGLLLAEPLGK